MDTDRLSSMCFIWADTEGWDEDWGWTEDRDDEASVLASETSSNVETNDDEVNKWLQGSIVSLSPNNDIIAVANDDRICVLTRETKIHPP